MKIGKQFINNMETQTKKLKFPKSQKCTVIELKNSLKSLNSKLNQTEERMSKPEDRPYRYPIEGKNE